jgi:hypothetical protein
VVFKPAMVIVATSIAVLPSRFENQEQDRPYAASWRTVSQPHFVQFSDLGDPVAKRRDRNQRVIRYPTKPAAAARQRVWGTFDQSPKRPPRWSARNFSARP